MSEEGGSPGGGGGRRLSNLSPTALEMSLSGTESVSELPAIKMQQVTFYQFSDSNQLIQANISEIQLLY